MFGDSNWTQLLQIYQLLFCCTSRLLTIEGQQVFIGMVVKSLRLIDIMVKVHHSLFAIFCNIYIPVCSKYFAVHFAV